MPPSEWSAVPGSNQPLIIIILPSAAANDEGKEAEKEGTEIEGGGGAVKITSDFQPEKRGRAAERAAERAAQAKTD